MSSLGVRLKEAREGVRLTQMQAAKKLGISNGTLSGYERNYRDPDTTMLAKLANLYDKTTDWLTGNDNTSELAQLVNENAGEPGSEKRVEFAQKFMGEFLKLSQETQQSLYELVKNMPK